MRKLLTALAVAGASLTGVVLPAAHAAPQADPTAGLKQYSDTFKVQHPYNLPESARFSTTAGPEYNAWIMKGDKPFSQ